MKSAGGNSVNVDADGVPAGGRHPGLVRGSSLSKTAARLGKSCQSGAMAAVLERTDFVPIHYSGMSHAEASAVIVPSCEMEMMVNVAIFHGMAELRAVFLDVFMQ